MAKITVTKALTGFFNTGDGKRSTTEWMGELKALTTEEKAELAALVCAVTGDSL
jgi:hypothetical protein